ncbi:TetR family transcriptional regulator [Actinomycetospora sp. NBRC 106375]|uniref:TetR/AcrR family transcriptional regulator n=1 Tax=Actinomycetospora sp. NBRC 106375 TaxID=3032207 RepID=UPI00249FD80F|nr:TetR/AcrR family transcriptional regulator [Actinomycetospora sp. NBRC 106375]GLZ46775.1 TetR family transcriptional regulator [Actinomycetospora sp. NBRC 106375]
MPKKVDPHERRAQIARALHRVIAGRGLDEVSLRHVATEAGVSAGLVQHWFRTKDEMLRFALEVVAEQGQARLARRGAEIEHGTPREAVRALLVELLPLDEERRLEAHVALAFGARAAVSPEIARWVRDGMDQMRAFVADRLRAAGRVGDPEAAAVALTAMVDGLAAHVLAEQCTPEAAEAAFDDHLDTVLGL